MPNQHETEARAKKVARLVAHFDQWIRDAGHDPQAHAAMVADTLNRMTPDVWAQHAVVCGIRPPSTTTIEAVITEYRKRSFQEERVAS